MQLLYASAKEKDIPSETTFTPCRVESPDPYVNDLLELRATGSTSPGLYFMWLLSWSSCES
jgi:hypothetical protein